MEKISIKIPAKSIYIKSLRLFSSSLASDLCFDIEEIEDIKVLISEAINYKLEGDDLEINFINSDKLLQIEVLGNDTSKDQRALEMRNQILKALSDDVQIEDNRIVLNLRAKWWIKIAKNTKKI